MMWNENPWLWVAVLGGCALVGMILGLFVARKLADEADNTDDTEEAIRRHAEKRRQLILDEACKATAERYQAARDNLRETFEVETKLYEKLEADLSERQSELDKKLHATELEVQNLSQRHQEVETFRVQTHELLERAGAVSKDLGVALSQRVDEDYHQMVEAERAEVLNTTRLELSRWGIDNLQEVQQEAKRRARSVLEDVYARYKPTFVWPKGSYTIDLPSRDVLERHFSEQSDGLVPMLVAGTMTSIEALKGDDQSVGLKISGGSGVDKEVLRMTLEEVVSRKQFGRNHVEGILTRNRRKVEKLVAQMGHEAIKKLGLPPVHTEIEFLIGSLNYRTSHRQNQYFHSLEVATLAGMLADELGVDPLLAKRSGILHDIGKALDYRIEGSHAVISGDYAQKCGEAEVVVDTVLSHHDDKVVETAHAYILKAADAMSGARPGARVDMEEGYQKRIEGIADVVGSFRESGVVDSLIMHAGREVHVFVDNRRVKERDIDPLAQSIARKLESDVQFPGQIKVTVVRRLEVSEVA
jgi:ribonuclease Y